MPISNAAYGSSSTVDREIFVVKIFSSTTFSEEN